MKILPPRKRITLIQKLILSYSAIALFFIAAIVFSTTGLYSLNKIVNDIAENDFFVINSANRLLDSINAQERYAAKYSILRSPEFQDLFRRRQAEFLTICEKVNHHPVRSGKLASLAKTYGQFKKESDLVFHDRTTSLQGLKTSAEHVRLSIDSVYNQHQSLLNAKLDKANQKQFRTVQWSLVISLLGMLLAVGVIVIVVYDTSSAMKKLKRATLKISEGEFDYDPEIVPGDEFGDLARDFTSMAAKLKVLEQISLDASPLTRLPGNIAIEKVLDRKLQEDEPFAVCYGDLDNFKAYNDRYGYIKGSEVIKMTGEIIYDAVNKHSQGDTFVGHVGGDDFVMVLPTKDVTPVCTAVIDNFTTGIREHYNDQDLSKGAIEGKDRYGVKRIFPIMTISIAVLTCKKGQYDSAVKIAKAAVQIKEYAKESPGSNYLVDRRRKER